MYTEFSEALHEELPALRRMARWFAGDTHRAEDLLQDTLVLALRFRDNFEHGTNIRAWLMRVMRNRHISLMRRNQLERKIMETEGRHALIHWSIGASGRRSMQSDGDVYQDRGLSDTVVGAMDETSCSISSRNSSPSLICGFTFKMMPTSCRSMV